MKPCISCGEPSQQTRCDEHRREQLRERNAKSTRKTNGARWQRLSKRLRRLQPWCEWCGATERLEVDHIIPVTERPDLEYNLAVLRILCRSCNSRRGTRVTDAERAEVERRLDQGRHPAPRVSSQARVAVETNAIENDSQIGGAEHGPAVTDRR